MCVRVHLFTQCGSEGPAPKSLIEAQETRHRTQKEPHSQGLAVIGIPLRHVRLLTRLVATLQEPGAKFVCSVPCGRNEP